MQAQRDFTFHVDFENLTHSELGLLCYALRPADAFCHKLGMGRPLGLGTVEIILLSLQYIDRPHRYLSLSGSRVSSMWTADEAAAEGIPAAPDSMTFPALSAAFRDLIAQHFPDLSGIIETLGDPAMVHYPVHYPQIAGPQPGDPTFETDRYEWFVANDNKNNRTDRQALAHARPGQPIPPMERLRKVSGRH